METAFVIVGVILASLIIVMAAYNLGYNSGCTFRRQEWRRFQNAETKRGYFKGYNQGWKEGRETLYREIRDGISHKDEKGGSSCDIEIQSKGD